MKRSISIYSIILCLGLVSWSQVAEAQKRGFKNRPNQRRSQQKSKNNDPFLRTQWWLGFKGGINLTQAVPGDRYTTFSPTVEVESATYDKSYEDFNKVGGQAGLDITFFHRGFSVSLQPNFRRQRFVYTTDYSWFDTNNTQNVLNLNYVQDHRLDYIEIPLLFKYDFLQTNIRPFVQLGGYWATLIDANKALTITGEDFASGGLSPFEGEEIIIGAKDLFINTSLGILGGVGANWDVGNIRLSMDVTYRFGLNNIVNAQNRFTENRLAGVGDAMDDVKLRNLSVSISCLFPMRFLVSSNYRAVD